MNINERFKNFPIKFYQTSNGVYYENSFIKGNAKSLNDAFSKLKNKLTYKELYYYYDDVSDIKFSSFEPAIKNTKTRKGIYLGKIDIQIELTDWQGEQTIKFLSKNPEMIQNHEKFIKKLKNAKARQEFMDKIKQGVKKVAGIFHEMFYPYKSKDDLICSHCGEIIPNATYYEEWRKQPYHLECIWDKLCNDNKSNEYIKANEYFMSLQELLDNWPGNLDCQDDYESDLELVKINQRNKSV